MEHATIIHSLTLIITILGILLISKKLTDFKIPLPISLISITFLIKMVAPHLVDIHSSKYFDLILLCLLPLILLPDALNLSWEDLKKHGISIFYLAVIAVALSIGVGILLKFIIFQQYMLTTGDFVALMAMVLATDAISVTNIFSQFKLPHSLKILAEGESLTNDATAVIAFYVVGLPLIGGSKLNFVNVSIDIFKVGSISILIGLLVGGLFFLLMYMFHKTIEELFLILMTTYTSFTVAEVYNMSGILAMIVAVVLFKTSVLSHLKNYNEDPSDKNEDDSFLSYIRKSVKGKYNNRVSEKRQNSLIATTVEKLRYNEEFIASFAIIGTAILFFALSELINIRNLIFYWKEILIIFIATTLIRALMMLKFAYITNKTNKMHSVNLRWWGVLTFSGIKGGLSIIMVHNLPKTFQYKEMFETIVIGVVLLSIFIYSIALLALIKKYKKQFETEYDAELLIEY